MYLNDPVFNVVDSVGAPISGAKAYFYQTGTTTLVNTYTTVQRTVANTNPVIADSAGRFPPIYLNPDITYRMKLTDAADILIVDRDPIAVAGDGDGDETLVLSNIAALQVYNAPTVEIPELLSVISNYVAGDGGGTFRYDSTDTTTADNGGTVIVDTAGRRWKRQWSDAVDVVWFGARADGSANASAAFASALSGSFKDVKAVGTFRLDSMITIPKGVTLEAEGATFVPNANIDVIRLHGGARLVGFPLVDCTQFVGWNSAAILFDGASESSSATYFRLDQETRCEVSCKSGTTGSSKGTAIYFKTVDNGVNNQWIMGVNVEARVEGFDKALYMVKDGTDLIRTFVTSNHIKIDASSPLQTIVMESDHASGWSLDGNIFVIRSQSRAQADQLQIPVVLCGAQNDWNILQWDWLGGPAGTTKVCTLQAGAQLNLLRTWMDPTLLQNNSTSRTNIFINSWTEQGLVFGELRSIATDTVIRMHNSWLRADSQKGIELENAAGNNEWPAFTSDSGDNTIVRGNSAAGDGVYINAPNSTGFVGFQINTVLALLIDSNKHLYYPGFAGNANAVTIRNFNTAAYSQDFTDGAGILSLKVSVPASAAAAGKVGMWAVDSSWVYFCTASNTWVRAAVATW